MDPPPSCAGYSSNNNNAISAQWQLNETAGSAIAVAKGVLRAATSDTVQPIAILAADAFGATLAICQETQIKVEKEAKKHRPSYVVKFLQSSIGYAKDDCAFQLASSNSGVRFLGLAAALICTHNHFTAARALALMITSSSKQGQILPTVVQLQELLTAIEYKINRTGFAESVIGWETFVTEHPCVPDELRAYNFLSTDHPTIEVLEKLVDAFRGLDRLGHAASVHIRAGSCCPWVVAFVKWCLGVPPNVVLEDGTVLLDQPQAKVTVVALMEPSVENSPLVENMDNWKPRAMEFEIAVHQDLGEPRQLWSFPGIEQERWHGMVSIAAFGKRSLREYGMTAKKTIQEALPYCLALSIKKLRAEPGVYHISGFRETDFSRSRLFSDDESNEVMPSEFTRYLIGMFPKDSHILATLTEFLNLSDGPQATAGVLPEEQDIAELPLVAAHIRSLQKDCHCGECPGPQGVQWDQCYVTSFKECLARLTADVLAISLFDCIEPMLLHLGHLASPQITARRSFLMAINGILFGSGRGSCAIQDILQFALSMAGHNVLEQLNKGNWVASEACGQVLYPQLFDTNFLNNHGMLRLGGGPGKLSHDGQFYGKVCGRLGEVWKTAFKTKEWDDEPVDRLRNLMQSERLEWQVSAGDRVLYLFCGATCTLKRFNPYTILDAACRSLFITSCPHEPTATLVKPDSFSYFVTPIYEDQTSIPDSHGRHRLRVKSVGVVPTWNDESLRFFALAGGVAGVIRGPLACLQCCLDICRQAGLHYVVL